MPTTFESPSVQLTPEHYLRLRQESREALYRLGTPSNPGFTDENIVNGLRRAIGLTEVIYEHEVETTEFGGEYFRDSLGEILGLDLPPRTSDLLLMLSGIPRSLGL